MLVEFLQANPTKAAAWARVHRIEPSEIPDYVAGLTPVYLLADTRVTNHGFANGTATPRQAVLQAGTAVLVDDRGMPRVRCKCGNPLLDPVAVNTTPTYTGNRWPGFDPAGVAVVSPAPKPITDFVLTNPATGDQFTVPAGSAATSTTSTTAAVTTTVPPATTTTNPAPTTTRPAPTTVPPATAPPPAATAPPPPATTPPPPATTPAPDPAAVDAAWRRAGRQIDFGGATTATVECPPGGAGFSVWGTGVFTDDSSVCTAAVHAGLITFAGGGTVRVERLPGQDSYQGSVANGVTSYPYGPWSGSFRFTG
jgi:hypothetical protein